MWKSVKSFLRGIFLNKAKTSLHGGIFETYIQTITLYTYISVPPNTDSSRLPLRNQGLPINKVVKNLVSPFNLLLLQDPTLKCICNVSEIFKCNDNE